MYSIQLFGLFFPRLDSFRQLQYECNRQDKSSEFTILSFELWLRRGHMLDGILQISLRNASFVQKMLSYEIFTLLEAFITLI